MLHKNKLIKKTNSTEEASGLLSRAKGVEQRIGDPKAIQRLLTFLLAIFARKQGTSRRII